MQRLLGIALGVTLLLSSSAAAQVSSLGVATPPGITFQSPPPRPAPAPPQPAPPHVSRPMPQPEGTSSRRSGQPGGDLFLAGPKTYAPRNNVRARFQRRGHFLPYAVSPYVVTPFPYHLTHHSPSDSVAGNDSAAPDAPADAGYLELDVAPRTTQIYIDGFFVGSADDFEGSRYALGAGSHRVELRADGFVTAAFDFRTRPGETIIYTRSLDRLVAPLPVPEPVVVNAPVAAPKTLYVIPRCYAGDRRPLASDLPAHCSLSELRVVN
jgi:hypothetical protein